MERVKTFSIGKKHFDVTFPNVGQIIDMESLKQGLSSNRYGQMAASGIASNYYALDLIDMIAFYKVLCPEVTKYFNIENYADLDMQKANELLDPFKKELQPWYIKTMQEIQGIGMNGTAEEDKDNKG